MRIKPKSKEKSPENKQCLQITEFKYEGGLKSNRKKRVPIEIDQSHPLKILQHKLSLNSETLTVPNAKPLPLEPSQAQQQLFKTRRQEQYKKMLTPRDTLFQPRRSVFNRYNYETYNNYEYKNPFKPRRFPYDDKMQHPLKNNPSKGSEKNLEIVFCQHKYQDFVQKSNNRFREFCQTSRDFPVVHSPKRKTKSKTKLQRYGSESKIYSSTFYNARKKKTTLSNYLQQFNTLQKLSEYMQREHKLNQKYLLHSTGDLSRTVLLQIVTHRFDFLKKMKKKTRESIFRILFGEQAQSPLFKINIQDYIKLIQLFISRDAEPKIVAMFIFKFLFREDQVEMDHALAVLDLVGNSVGKHKLVEARLQQVINACGGKPKEVYEAIRDDEMLRNAFMDLITET